MLVINLFLALSSLHAANIGKTVENMLKSAHFSNRTSAQAYKAQGARYFTLGGVSQRTKISAPFNFVDVQMPKMSAGCGGIDIYSGGFKMVNSDQLLKHLRSIGQSAKTLPFMLAIQVVSPQISSIMENIQTWANKFNQFNMDSCSASRKLVGGALNYLGAREESCTIERLGKFNETYAEAAYACRNGGQLEATEAMDSQNASRFLTGNVVWNVLMQDSQYFKNNLPMAELVMNLTGTMVFSSRGGLASARAIPSAVSGQKTSSKFESIFDALMYGKRPSTDNDKMTGCEDLLPDPKACQRFKPKAIEIQAGGLAGMIKTQIAAIVKKIREETEDTKLTSEEKSLIETTSIPLYRFLNVVSAFTPKSDNTSEYVGNFTEFIAKDLVYGMMNDVLSRARQTLYSKVGGVSFTEQLKVLEKQINDTLAAISRKKEANKKASNRLYEMQQQIKHYEQALMGRLDGGLLANALWEGA